MKIIVGLGNIGDKYDNTRHNVGFVALDEIVGNACYDDCGFVENKKFESMMVEYRSDEKILYVKPTTFMNLSGRAVAKIAKYYEVSPQDIWVIHDDLDLPFGEVRIKKSGGHGGHHGVESIMNGLGSDEFVRIRIGVGKKDDKAVMDKDEGANYVLSGFSKEESEQLKQILQIVDKILVYGIANGVDECMNKYNKKISGNMPMEADAS